MAGSAATPGWFQGMWEASIPSFDGDVRRRPYHRNCSCALHRSRAVAADAPCPSQSSVSYPIRRRSSSLSSTNLAAATAGVNPAVSFNGGDTAVAFKIDDED